MYDSIQDRVFKLVTGQTGVGIKRLKLTTTLSRDLGLEGDDAVEFFDAYGREFTADLTGLDADWHCYFSAEGVGLMTALVVVVPAVVLAYGIGRLFGGLPFWLPPIAAFVLWLASIWLWQQFLRKAGPQISIHDLVDCAKAGKWVKALPDQIRNRHSKYAKYGGVSRWFIS